MIIYGIIITTLLGGILGGIYEITKKMDKILNIMQGKPIDYKEDKKKKKEQD